MMVDLYQNFATPLSDKIMLNWPTMLLSGGDTSIHVIGGYRTHPEPMQVVSGPSKSTRSILRLHHPIGCRMK